jgi:hypothetical protein
LFFFAYLYALFRGRLTHLKTVFAVCDNYKSRLIAFPEKLDDSSHATELDIVGMGSKTNQIAHDHTSTNIQMEPIPAVLS